MRRVMAVMAAVTLLLGFILGCGVVPTHALSAVPTTPANGSTLPSLTPVITWVSFGNYEYHVQVATDTAFQSLVVNESRINQMLYYVPAGRLTGATTYFWRVRASSDRETGPWSATSYFTTPGSSPTPPTPPPVNTGTINISTSLNGAAWTGSVSYTLTGPTTLSGTATPQSFSNLPAGTYTLNYSFGGPSGAAFEGISPSATQALAAGGNLNFNVNMRSQVSAGSIHVNALLNGQPWTGPVNYTVSGPMTGMGSQVPKTSTGLIPGSYTFYYNGGGPTGATLTGVTPSTTQVLASGGALYFTLNYTLQQPTYGSVMINATYDGSPWQTTLGSGGISYSLTGPNNHSGSSIPLTYNSQPTGTYTLSFNSGGPPGSVLESITPHHTQTLASGGTIAYTFNFRGQERGAVHVTATLNGQPWSGSVGYVVHGPYVTSGGSVPQSFSDASAGTYSISYSSGGPPGAVFEGITPSSQVLPAGGNIYFNIRFKFQGVQQ